MPVYGAGIRIVTGQADRALGVVAHKKVRRQLVCVLDVRIVAAGALDVALDELHRLSGIVR